MSERKNRKLIYILVFTIILTLIGTTIAIADDIGVDGDIVAPGNQSTVNLGTVAPGVTLNPKVSFQLICDSAKHVDSGQTITLTYNASASTIPSGGSLSASTTTIGSIPPAWPDDTTGSPNCGLIPPSPIGDNGDSTATIVAPMAPGSYTYNVKYDVGLSPAGTNDSASIKANFAQVTFTLTVSAPACNSPSVTTNPSGQSVVYGADATFSAAASGNPTPTVQWQVSTDTGLNWADVGGATNTTLTISSPTVAMNGNQYRAVFTNSCAPGSATSTAATLTVNKASVNATAGSYSGTYDGSAYSPGSCVVTAIDPNTYTGDLSCTNDPASVGPGIGSGIVVPVVIGTGLANFDITSVNGSWSISKRDATWTTNPNSKTYGDADPSPLTTGNGSNFVAADGVTATYSRVAGETVAGSPYHITAALSATVAGALDNYNITTPGADFTINKRDATWTTNPNSKIYGDADPSPLTTGNGTNFVAADGVTATYSRVAGETVAGSPYHITAALSATVAGALYNYNITNPGADFTILRKAASVTPDAKSKFYGEADPTLTGTLDGFLAGDNVTATYSRTAGETVAGSPYTISAVLSPTGVLSNYDITYNTAKFTILAWTLKGFYQPVDMGGVYNILKGGSTVPFKFEIFAATELTDVGYVGPFMYAQTSCDATAITDPIETTATGGTSLRYDPIAGQFVYNWKTPKNPGMCYRVTVTTLDGSSLTAYFQLK